MSDSVINAFTKGTWNLGDDENIPKDSAQSSSNWLTQDGRLKLVGGRLLIGAEGGAGKITGLHYGFKWDGTKILYRKISTKIQWLNGSTWTDLITGLTADSEYTFSNYVSLSGAFTITSGIDGIYKIINSNTPSYCVLKDSTSAFRGFTMIDRSRIFLWNTPTSKTHLFCSYIDQAIGTDVTNEAVGAFGSATYTGTLAFKAGGASRNSYVIKLVGTVTAGTETFTDNYMGVLTSNFGGTGTINYATGVYSVTFSDTTITNAVVVTYTWEDSNNKGISDFTYPATRLGGEGNNFGQEIGGDAILNVLVGLDNVYYSIKSNSAYALTIPPSDVGTAIKNEVYRKDLGMPSFRAAISTIKGVVFMNTANPSDPILTILRRNEIGTDIEPYPLISHFDFSKYDYEDCAIDSYDRYITISCRSKGNLFNDIILLCDTITETIDETKYQSRVFAKTNGKLYIGSPVSESVYEIYTGFDDDSDKIVNEWVSKGEGYEALGIAESLKKIKKLRIKGAIDPDQEVEVYVSYDDDSFQLVGTILGSGTYVDYGSPQSVGSNIVGTEQIGGSNVTTVYPFYCELKLTKIPKFRKRTIKFVATGIGYVEIESLMDTNIFIFEKRIPKRFRSKQNVSLDGHTVDTPEADLTGVESHYLITEDDAFIEL